ncbi:hypothetical protein P7C73_g5152, partial [Tremellales sp. Uapishka_1]
MMAHMIPQTFGLVPGPARGAVYPMDTQQGYTGQSAPIRQQHVGNIPSNHPSHSSNYSTAASSHDYGPPKLHSDYVVGGGIDPYQQYIPVPNQRQPQHRPEPLYSQQFDANQFQQPIAGPSYGPHPTYLTHQTVHPANDFRFGSAPIANGFPGPDGCMSGWQSQEWDDDLVEHLPDGQEIIYGNLEVKHRRRTTPEQLKVLEHYFDVNPKPDNALREWLAQELSMTKRNVQVWFQNRRAKVKGQKIKNGNMKTTSQTSGEPSPPLPTVVKQAPTMLLPPVDNLGMGRRVSLAGGEAARIETWAAKRAATAAAKGQSYAQYGLISPPIGKSPVAGQAAAARRGSIPYPINTAPDQRRLSITGTGNGNGSGNGSPKFSPGLRPSPSFLHLTAIRNNTRRASMPGAAQLISSGPFTPPRIVSSTHQVGNGRGIRELSPIKDLDAEGEHRHSQTEFSFDENQDVPINYLTPPSSAYLSTDTSPTSSLQPGSYHQTIFDSSLNPAQTLPFSPNSPYPNPAFSFGAPSPQHCDNAETAQAQALYAAFRQGRLGSLASVMTNETDTGSASDYGHHLSGDWLPNGNEPDGFIPDMRRASAPPDLLHNMGILGITPAQPLRPSPLANGFTDPVQLLPQSQTHLPTPAYYTQSSTSTPSHSNGSSDGPSPPLTYPHQQQLQPTDYLNVQYAHPQLVRQSSAGHSDDVSISPFPRQSHSVSPGLSAFVPDSNQNQNQTHYLNHPQPPLDPRLYTNGRATETKEDFSFLHEIPSADETINILV